MTIITPLPTPVPQRNDPSSFSLRADEFLTALPTFADETNVVAGEVNTNAANAATSATKSQNYATKDDGFAEGSDNSAKSWAVGGTGSGQPTAGSAKDWATSATSPNGTTDNSAKTYASEAATSASNALTSANNSQTSAELSEAWAISPTSPDMTSSKSSKSYAEDSAASAAASEASKVISVTKAGEASTSASAAASSAAAAAAAAASVGFQDVVFITAANSPYNVTQATSGKLIACDTTAGNIVVHLPVISSLTLPFVVGAKKTTSDANTVSITLSGSDTFDDGSASKSVTTPAGFTLLPDTDTAPDVWTSIGFGGANAGSVTSSGLTMDTAKLLGRNTAGNGAIEEIPIVTQPEAEAGVVTELRGFTPQRISQAIVALSPKGISTVGSVITSSTSLTASSEGYQPVQMSSIGQSITLPDATTIVLPGGPKFIIDNTQGGYPVGIRDYSGKLLMGVAAGGEAYVSLKSSATQAGTWSITGTNLEPGLITLDNTFSSTYTSVAFAPYIVLDSNTSIHFAQIASGSGLAAYIVDNTGKVISTPTTVYASSGAILTAFKISSTQGIVFLSDSATGTTRAAVLTVSGTSPALSLSVGAVANSSLAGDASYHLENFTNAPKIVQLSPSLYLYSLAQSATRTSTIAVSVSGTTVTFGTAADIITTTTTANAVTTTYALTATTALVLYRSGAAAPITNNAVVVSVSGTTCTFGTPVALTSVASGSTGSFQPFSTLVSPTKCIVADDNNTSTTVNAIALTISGTTVSIGTAFTVETTTNIANMLQFTSQSANRYNPHLWVLTTGATNTIGMWYADTSGISRVVVLSETSGVITKGTIMYRSVSSAAATTQGYGEMFPQSTSSFLCMRTQLTASSGYGVVVVPHKTQGSTVTVGSSLPLREIYPVNVRSSKLSEDVSLLYGVGVTSGNALFLIKTNGDFINFKGKISVPAISPGAILKVISENRVIVQGVLEGGTTVSVGTQQQRLLNVEIAA